MSLNRRLFAFLSVLVILVATLSTTAFATNGNEWLDAPLSPTGTTTSSTFETDVVGTLSPTGNNVYNGPHIDGRDAIQGDIADAQKVYSSYIDVMPVVSTNDILKWATTKGNEIIYFLQIIVQPFTIIIFIVAAFITLIGSIGRGDMVGKGVWGMICSVLVYAAVLYAPVILQTFVGWIAS